MNNQQKSKYFRKTIFLCLAVLCIYIMTLFFKTVRANIYNVGNLFGLAGSAFLTLCCLANEKVEVIIKNIWKKRAGRVFLVILIATILILSTICIIFSVLMAKAMNNQPKASYPVIVLGCQVYGTNPSPMLKRRLEAAKEYLDKYPEEIVVVTGGQGKGEDIPEAKAMHDWLIDNGIEEKRIIVEDKSVNTSENLENAKKLLDDVFKTDEVVIISDGFHQYRASFLAKQYGLKTYAINAKTNPDYVPTFWVREWVGLAKDIIFSAF